MDAPHSPPLAVCPSVGPLHGVSRLVHGGQTPDLGDGYAGEEYDPSPTCLDTQETTAKIANASDSRIDFDRFMAEKGSRDEFFSLPVLDENSLSACFRHSGWRVIRQRVFASLLRTSQSSSRRASFGCCGSYSWVEQSQTDPSRFRLRHNHCNDRLCTPCANERSRRLSNSVLSLIEGKTLSFITFTLCGKGESLSTLLDRLYKHFKALRQLDIWTDAVKGGVAFLEIKWNDRSQRWHPHLHVLADAKYIEKTALQRAWLVLSKDSFIVDIRRVRDSAICGRYVTKYASKPLNTSFSNTPRLLDEAVTALKGRRLCFAFGEWYGKALIDEDLNGDDALDLLQADWKIFMDLETLLLKCNHGSPESMHILRCIGGEDLWRQTLTPT